MNAPFSAPNSVAPPAEEPFPRSTFFRWRRRVRILKERSAGFDLRWAVMLACLLALTSAAWPIPNLTVQQIIPWAAMAAALLAVLYFGHILFFRIQCSLLEFLLIIAALGNLEGMLLTTPGIFSVGRDWVMVLAPLGVAWLFYGAVIGLVQAKLSGRVGTFARLFYIVAGWLSTGAPAMVGLGTALWMGRHETRVITRNLSAWAIPLLTAGVCGAFLRFWLSRTAKRTAKAIVYAPPERTVDVSS